MLMMGIGVVMEMGIGMEMGNVMEMGTGMEMGIGMETGIENVIRLGMEMEMGMGMEKNGQEGKRLPYCVCIYVRMYVYVCVFDSKRVQPKLKVSFTNLKLSTKYGNEKNQGGASEVLHNTDRHRSIYY